MGAHEEQHQRSLMGERSNQKGHGGPEQWRVKDVDREGKMRQTMELCRDEGEGEGTKRELLGSKVKRSPQKLEKSNFGIVSRKS